MNIDNKYPVMIFKREYQGKEFYSVGLSKKDRNGNYINGYMTCSFKKGVSVPDKTKIYIKKAWVDFYLKEKETKPFIFISEFETIGQTIDRIHKENEEEYIKENFGTSITAEELDDLPF